MKRKKFSVEQIVSILKQATLGLPVADLIRQVGISEQTFYRWKRQYAGLESDQVREFKQLADENGLCLLKTPKSPACVAFPSPQSYRRQPAHASVRPWFPALVPGAQPRLAIEQAVTAPRSPWQNACVERIIGSIRRECLDLSVTYAACCWHALSTTTEAARICR